MPQMRSMHNGNLGFRFVSVPVKMYAATSSTTVKFHHCHQHKDGSVSRINQVRKCSDCGAVVEYGDLVKGVEREDGSIITVTDEELESVKDQEISDDFEIVRFVESDEIDPILYSNAYYLVPDATTGEKARGARHRGARGGKMALESYALLRHVLVESGRVGIVKYTLRGNTHVAVLRVSKQVLVMQNLTWPSDLRAPEFPVLDRPVELDQKAVEMAEALVGSMAGVYKAADYVNADAARVAELVAAKEAGMPMTVAEEEAATEDVSDLMAMLEASIKSHPAGRKQRVRKSA